VLFMSMGPDDVSELRPPTQLLFIPQVIYEYGQPRWNDTGKGNRRTPRKTCLSATFSTINPTPNAGLRGERLVSNRLSHDTASIGACLLYDTWTTLQSDQNKTEPMFRLGNF
jgi:hypothetical protein